MTEPEETPVPTHDDAIGKLVKTLINGEVAESENSYGKTAQERLRTHMKSRADSTVMGSIVGLSTYLQARASERQAAALESLAKTISQQQTVNNIDTDAQAIVDQRESKRDYLASTYSLPTETLSLLWAMRGMLMDASVKSLSRPDRFDPYRRLSTEEIAWSLRLTPEELWDRLPHHADGPDYELLEEFDLMHYGGTMDRPDDWVYGG